MGFQCRVGKVCEQTLPNFYDDALPARLFEDIQSLVWAKAMVGGLTTRVRNLEWREVVRRSCHRRVGAPGSLRAAPTLASLVGDQQLGPIGRFAGLQEHTIFPVNHNRDGQ